MRNLRELVNSLRARTGVRAVVVHGRDGLVIESNADAGISADEVAARMPGVVLAFNELGSAGLAGTTTGAVVLHEAGIFIASRLTSDVFLVVVTERSAHFGDVLFELARDRDRMAALL